MRYSYFHSNIFDTRAAHLFALQIAKTQNLLKTLSRQLFNLMANIFTDNIVPWQQG